MGGHRRRETSAAALFREYVLPLAAIGPAASIFGLSVIGVRTSLGGTYRMPPGAALRDAVANYAISLLSVYLLSLIVDALAPVFAGRKDAISALKVTVYAGTPGWLAGIFLLVPATALLQLLAMLYGICLLFLGLPVLMTAPQERAAMYAAAVVVCGVMLFTLLGWVLGPLVAPLLRR